MAKIVIWGIGQRFNKISSLISDEIVAYIDSNQYGEKRQNGVVVAKPEDLKNIIFDKLIITSNKYKKEILDQILSIDKTILNKVCLWEDYFKIDMLSFQKIERVKRHKVPQINNIYVVAPNGVKTGGTELLHQLVFMLRKNGLNAYIAYIDNNGNFNDATDKSFIDYVNDNRVWLEDVIDVYDNLIVIPEIYPDMIRKFEKASIYFWWLSVDNFFGAGGFDYIEDVQTRVDKHLYQSFYAKKLLEKIGVDTNDCLELSDYINDIYLLNDMQKEGRENIVVYNPQKGFLFTQKLLKKLGGCECVPIENMTNDQIVKLLSKSKVYIDFGNHPGKDRLPREAASMGCCVITGRRGAANNKFDICINDKFKFDDEEHNLDRISDMIHECIYNYDSCTMEFNEYREKIKNEKERFVKQMRRVFDI